MRNMSDSTSVPGYLSVKEAAQALGLSPSRIYEYVEDGRLSSVRAAHVILIPVEDVQKFTPTIAGRPRKSVPRWRISPENNRLIATVIRVQMRPDCQEAFEQKLEAIKQEDRFLFPGTISRFIRRSEIRPEQIEIALMWRSTAAPSKEDREKELRALQGELDEVLDWNTAEYDHGPILLHT
jgi:excisionase family DNA binding protein